MSEQRPVKAVLRRAIALVEEGLTFQEAADHVGVTRNSVAGACWRAGVKAEFTDEKRDRFRQRMSETWDDPDTRARRVAGVREAWRRSR